MDEELDWPDEELDWANELCDGARRGRLSYVEELLDWGADVDARDDRNVTPLHYAVFYRHTAVVDLLCERGADVDAAVCGTTALHLTADVMIVIVTEGGLNLPQPRERESARCAELLIAAGAEVDAEYERKTPLALALKSGHRRLVKILLEAGANARLAAASRPFLWTRGAPPCAPAASPAGRASWATRRPWLRWKPGCLYTQLFLASRLRVNIAAREQQSKFRKKRAGGSEERSKRTSTPTASKNKPATGKLWTRT